MGFFRHLRDLVRFMQLPRERRQLTVYSEGKNYWPHLQGLVMHLVEKSQITVCYITSGADDPGLELKHPNYQTFLIDHGAVRNWLFENIDTDVMLMTMPDLNQYQVKRSKHPVHYIYVQHSLVSMHMAYRKGAFDHYDTIFCAGPHHMKEIRAMEQYYDLPSKNLVAHGYGRLDEIMAENKRRSAGTGAVGLPEGVMPTHVLVAPSWGQGMTIESGVGEQLVDQLLERGHRVTLRPHPQTIRLAKKKVSAIVNKHGNNPSFFYEANVDGQESLHTADVMISDWSGAALDYAFGLNKPVLFVDRPRKVNNPDYDALGVTPIEVVIRSKIGGLLDLQRLDLSVAQNKVDIEAWVYNPGTSAEYGSDYIINLITQIGST